MKFIYYFEDNAPGVGITFITRMAANFKMDMQWTMYKSITHLKVSSENSENLR